MPKEIIGHREYPRDSDAVARAKVKMTLHQAQMRLPIYGESRRRMSALDKLTVRLKIDRKITRMLEFAEEL